MTSIDPKELESFLSRIRDLHVSIDNVEKLVVVSKHKTLEIPNIPGKQNSLQLYIFLSQEKNGIIDEELAKKGLQIFGDAFIQDAKANPGKHPAIDLLLSISSKKIEPVHVVITEK